VKRWIGGAAAVGVDPVDGVEYLDTRDRLEQRVTFLAVGR